MKTEYEYASRFAPEFNGYLALRGNQGHQYKRELHYFKTLDRYLVCEKTNEKYLSAKTIEGWLQSLPSDMSINTKIVYISHYSQFAKYLNTLGIAAFIPERPVDDKSYIPYVFSEEEIIRLFAAADNLSHNHIGHDFGFAGQDFPVILRLLYGCGLRVNEALRLRIGDIDTQAGVMLIRNAKGNKDRLVPTDATLTTILRQYIFTYHCDSSTDTFLFANSKNEQYSDTIVRTWFNITLETAGIVKPELPKHARNICPHCLRHTFAVYSFRKQDLAGVDMYAAEPFMSAYMGHTRLYGTETYLHMTAENSVDVIAKTTAYAKGLFPEVPK